MHVLNGATNYTTWLLHIGTPLHETGDNFEFLMGDYNRDGFTDVYAIKKSGTGTKTTEVHILNGASNYQTWLLQTGTPLHETGDNFEFVLFDHNRDGIPDVYAIKKSATGSNSTEVHILNGVTNYQAWSLHTGTPIPETGKGTLPAVETTGGGEQVPNNTYCTDVADWPAASTALEEAVLVLVNQVRSTGYICEREDGSSIVFPPGGKPVKMQPNLRCATRKHSKDMATNNYFAHDSQDGTTPWQRISSAGYPSTSSALGENIAAGQATAAAAVQSWLKSKSGHCETLMHKDATDMGIGFSSDEGSDWTNYWTQVFGKQ